MSVVAQDKASTVAAIRDILILIEKEKEQALESQMSDLRKEVEKKRIYDIDDTHRTAVNMHGYNDALDEVLLLLNK